MSMIPRFLIVLCSVGMASAQVETDDAHVNLYFPAVLDGGPAAQQWQTVFNFTNPGGSAATVNLNLIANDGTDLSLDLGNGPGARWTFTLPAYARRSFVTKGTGATTVSGWATAFSNVPIRAWAGFRQSQTGAVRSEATLDVTLPSTGCMLAAQSSTMVSLANVYDTRADDIVLTLRTSDGKMVSQQGAKLPSGGRLMFQLTDAFTTIAQDFTGTLQIVGATPADIFVAGALGRDAANNLYGIRAGKYTFPVSQWDRIWLVFEKLVEAARPLIPDVDTIDLKIDESNTLNALAQNGKTVTVTMALAELVGDSPSELAFAVAHQMGHIYQQRTRRLDFVSDNREFDADMWAVVLTLSAGYDPYAGTGSLAKLAMATGPAGLASQYEGEAASDSHKSLAARIDLMYTFVTLACNYSPEAKSACALYKSIVHPHFPDAVPLGVPRRPLAESGAGARELREPIRQ